MPHGLTVDFDGNIWVTDVGLHQAIKFDQQGNELLTLGTRLQPGSDSTHLCKPTHVSCQAVCTIQAPIQDCGSEIMHGLHGLATPCV